MSILQLITVIFLAAAIVLNSIAIAKLTDRIKRHEGRR